MMRVSRILAAAVMVCVLGVFGAANAKFFPYVEPIDVDWGGLDAPQPIADAGMFAGVYGRLDVADDIDALSFEFERAVTDWSIRPMVPVCGEDFEAFYPSVAVIGPELDVPEADVSAELPFELPEGMGAAVFMDTERPVIRSTEEGGFVQENYASTEYLLDIPEAGNYLVVVWDAESGEGAYVLATGATHPSRLTEEQIEEMEAGFELIENGEWLSGFSCL